MIRDAASGDVPALREIYNALITTTTIAWTEVEETLAERGSWFDEQRTAGHPVLVAEVDGDVIGFCSYGSFRGLGRWPGYRFTVEHTIHVREPWWGRGVGRSLMESLIDRAVAAGLHAMVGAVDGANADSLAFHRRLGFVEVARMPEVGRKFDRWLDLALVQKTLGDGV